MRFLLKLIVLLVVLLAVAVGGALFYVNEVAKAGIERGAEYALGVKTTVDSVGIRLLAGEVRVNDLQVANPPGYAEPHFLRIGSFTLHVPPRNLVEDSIEVSLIALDGVVLDIERGKKSSNYGKILDGLKKFESTEPTPKEQGASKEFIVRELTVTDVTAKLRQDVIAGQAAAVTVVIPEVRLRDIGSQSGGVTMGELTGIVTKALLDAVTKAGGVPSAILGDLAGGLKGLGKVNIELPEGVGTAAEAAGAIGTQLGGKTGKEVGKVLEGLGGLLGKPREKSTGEQ